MQLQPKSPTSTPNDPLAMGNHLAYSPSKTDHLAQSYSCCQPNLQTRKTRFFNFANFAFGASCSPRVEQGANRRGIHHRSIVEISRIFGSTPAVRRTRKDDLHPVRADKNRQKATSVRAIFRATGLRNWSLGQFWTGNRLVVLPNFLDRHTPRNNVRKRFSKTARVEKMRVSATIARKTSSKNSELYLIGKPSSRQVYHTSFIAIGCTQRVYRNFQVLEWKK